jgi:hypothetical protein
MKEATVLLSTTFLTVKEIMVRVGFLDESHFVKDFKKIYGTTPTEYRKSKANDNGHVSVLGAPETGLSVSVFGAVATGSGRSFDLPRCVFSGNLYPFGRSSLVDARTHDETPPPPPENLLEEWL